MGEVLSYIVGLIALGLFGYFIYRKMTAPKTPGSGSGAGGTSGPRDPTRPL